MNFTTNYTKGLNILDFVIIRFRDLRGINNIEMEECGLTNVLNER